MRIVTFNTCHGRAQDGTVDTAALARYCASLDADVLALQEVDVRSRRSGGVDQVAAVADATGLTSYFGPARRLGLRGRYGNALLVRGMIEEAQTVALPRAGHHEDRSFILAEVIVGDLVMAVAATHLSADEKEAGIQLEALLVGARHLNRPRVVLGDFNLRAEQLAPALATRAYALADPLLPTFPATLPRLRIDHVLCDGIAIRSAAVPDAAPVSDHRALVVEVG